jgi:tRNA-Thr(GGU) m(6)t(6)A37 methyltransferase TsaA
MTNVSHPQQVSLNAIGVVESPYKEKFAIPRQANIVTAAKGRVLLSGQQNNIDTIRDIEQFSHLWLLFIFHATQAQGWKPLVRPPRLGGNKKTGVLATRSPFRPNPVGMSVVKLDKVSTSKQRTVLHISGLDLLDGTPIFDIKPYIPYSDAITTAQSGYAQHPMDKLSVTFSQKAKEALVIYERQHSELASFIEQVLAQDPRPAYKSHQCDKREYGMRLYDLNIRWQLISVTSVIVLSISAIG